MAEMQTKFYIEYLKREFHKRRVEDKKYSLRSYASDLEMHHTALSRILNQTQEISLASSQVIVEKLGLNLSDRRQFLASVAEEKWYKSLESLAAAIGETSAESFEFLQVPFEAALRRLAGQEHLPVTSPALLRSTPYKIYVIDREGRYLYANSEQTLTGLETQQGIGKTIRDLGFSDETVQAAEAQQAKAFETGEASTAEFLLTTNGERICYERTVIPVRNPQSEVVALVATGHEVRVRDLDQSGMMTRMLYECAPVSMGMVDSDLKVVQANAELARLFHRKTSEVVGRSLEELLPEGFSEIETPIKRVLASGQPELRQALSAELLPNKRGHLTASYIPIMNDQLKFRGVGWTIEVAQEASN